MLPSDNIHYFALADNQNDKRDHDEITCHFLVMKFSARPEYWDNVF